MHRQHFTLRAVFGSAALFIFATSCAEGTSPRDEPVATTEPDSPGTSSKPLSSGYAMKLPIASFSFTEDETKLMKSAESVIVVRCMKDFGFDFTPPPREAKSVTTMDRRYGLADPEHAKKYGYHLPPLQKTQEPLRPSKEATEVLVGSKEPYPTGEKVTTYKGAQVPEGGCRGKASKEVRQKFDDADGASIANGISTESFRQSIQQQAVADAFQEWSSCMRKKGFTYKDPLSPLNNEEFFKDPVASSEEISTAVADTQCKKSTRLLEIWFNTEEAIQKEMIALKKKELDGLRVHHAKKLQNAQRILKED
ncbi:hypothetical protein ABXI76_18655 [Streptomyces parvus]